MKKYYIWIIFIIIVISIPLTLIIINQPNDIDYIINRNTEIKEIDFTNEKINVYVFWGNGCPHCEELFSLFEDIKKTHGKYANIYGFEVWYNTDNGEVMDNFLEAFDMKTGTRSVPFFIIGDQVFEGFDLSMKEEIINTIESKYHDRENIKNFKELLVSKQ